MFADPIRAIRSALTIATPDNAVSLGENVELCLQKMQAELPPAEEIEQALKRVSIEAKAFFALAENKLGVPNQPVIERRREDVNSALSNLEEVLSASDSDQKSQLH
jgi:hypothetical protein